MSGGPDSASRRSFVIAGAAALVSAGLVRVRAQDRTPLTAEQIVARIQKSVGVPWQEKTVDTFKAGDPGVAITGIATTAMATFAVLQQAAATRRNLVITQEPTFFAAADVAGDRANDPVYIEKRRFIEEHGLVVWRFSDHWLARRPLESPRALADALGWAHGRVAENEQVYEIAPTTVREVAAHLRARLNAAGGMRMVGRADAPVRRVALSPGTTDLASTIANLRDADLLLSGEPREWEVVEYVLDTASAGTPKSLLSIGRVVSEAPSVRACAAWLKTIVPEVPVAAIGMPDPYWRPAV